jgi:hypothetical protein
MCTEKKKTRDKIISHDTKIQVYTAIYFDRLSVSKRERIIFN